MKRSREKKTPGRLNTIHNGARHEQATFASMVLSEFQEAAVICIHLKQSYEDELAEARRQHLADAASVFESFVMYQYAPDCSGFTFFIELLKRLRVLPDPRPVMEKCFSQRPFNAFWKNNLECALDGLNGTEELYRFKAAAFMAMEDAAVKYLHIGKPLQCWY